MKKKVEREKGGLVPQEPGPWPPLLFQPQCLRFCLCSRDLPTHPLLGQAYHISEAIIPSQQENALLRKVISAVLWCLKRSTKVHQCQRCSVVSSFERLLITTKVCPKKECQNKSHENKRTTFPRHTVKECSHRSKVGEGFPRSWKTSFTKPRMVASSSDSLRDVMQSSLRGILATPKINFGQVDERAKYLSVLKSLGSLEYTPSVPQPRSNFEVKLNKSLICKLSHALISGTAQCSPEVCCK